MTKNIANTSYAKVIIIAAVLILLLETEPVFSQNRLFADTTTSLAVKNNSLNLFPQDSVVAKEEIEKNFLIPAVEVFAINMGVWAYNKYLTNEGWSGIGMNTMRQNFKTGFQWDDDGFLMNQFAHPYHGAQYFTAARTNGLSYWESMIYPYAGSLMWELFMENQAPSYNDVINTPVSGMILGEIMFRVSNLIIDESKEGFPRFISEAGALVISPVHGLNRLIRGDMWRSGTNKTKPDFLGRMSFGVNSIFINNVRANRRTFALAELDLNYGDMMNVSEHHKPFDFFNLHTELSFTNNDNISKSFASGVVWDKQVSIFNNSTDVFGLYKELDLLINQIYKFTATSITSRITSKLYVSDNLTVVNSVGLSGIFLGGINSKYSSLEGKDYNLGPGASTNLSTYFIFKNFGAVSTNYKVFWIHTLSGAAGEEFSGYFSIGITIRLTETTALGTNFMLYHRHAFYHKYSATTESDSAVKVFYSFMI
jgi:hypothetical protein